MSTHASRHYIQDAERSLDMSVATATAKHKVKVLRTARREDLVESIMNKHNSSTAEGDNNNDAPYKTRFETAKTYPWPTHITGKPDKTQIKHSKTNIISEKKGKDITKC